MKIEFNATIPPIQSAISVGGDGARIKLDIPETDIIEALKLVAVKNVILKVTIEVDDAKQA